MTWTPYKRSEENEKAFHAIYRRTPVIEQSFLFKEDENGKIIGVVETRTKLTFRKKRFELKEELTEANGLCKSLEVRCLEVPSDKEEFSRVFTSSRAWLEAEQDIVLACEE